MPDIQKVNESLEAAVQSLLNLKKALNEPDVQVQSTQSPQEPAQEPAQFDSFESLKKAVYSDQWPAAVNPNLICDPNSEKDKEERARGIIELMIEEDLKGKRFLDFGCGDGSVTRISKQYETEISVGFDIASQRWDEAGDFILTYDYDLVVQNGPYDVILMFDVLDHLKAEPPVTVLRKIKDLLKDDGKVYMRCHPFVSRHGTHLYHDLNKAFLHLVFNNEELNQIIPESKYKEDNIGIVYPIKTYNQFIEEAGLKIVNRRDLTEKVEDFFKIPKIADRILKNTFMENFPDFQMSLQFVDYVLCK